MKVFSLLLLLMFSLSVYAQDFGRCIIDPKASKLQESWKHYFELKKMRAYINTMHIVDEIKMDHATWELVKAISDTEKLTALIDRFEINYFQKAFVDNRFNEMISHPDFIQKLENREIDQEIRTSELKFKDDPKFYELLEELRSEVMRPEIKSALELFRKYDLGVLQISYRKSAKSALRLMRKRGATVEKILSWKKNPPLLKHLPYPGVQLGPFAVKYRSLVINSVESFVQSRNASLSEAKKVRPRFKQSDVDEMNAITPPTEINSFDDHIASLHPPQDSNLSKSDFNAIDGVVRTLWGEATSCQSHGLPQFEAIGRIIADRSLAVERSLNEQTQSVTKSSEVRKENWVTVLKNWVGIKRPAPGLKAPPALKLRGLSDFGRKEKKDIHPAAQVISKKGQFSVWNSYSIKKFHTGQFHKNVPDAVYEIQGPQAENDDQALVRILCPQFLNDHQKELWSQALSLSKDIVLQPKQLATKITWPTKEEILFYTHEAPLPFAREVKVPHLIVQGKIIKLRGKGRGPCDHFRLFVSKTKNQY
jgi:hypothetical protein